jgi:hypothetical protein
MHLAVVSMHNNNLQRAHVEVMTSKVVMRSERDMSRDGAYVA